MSAKFEAGDHVTLSADPVIDSPELCRDPRVVVAEVIEAMVLPCYWLTFPDGRPATPAPVAGHRLSRGWRSVD